VTITRLRFLLLTAAGDVATSKALLLVSAGRFLRDDIVEDAVNVALTKLGRDGVDCVASSSGLGFGAIFDSFDYAFSSTSTILSF
jgi:hypothetical protein